MDRNEAIKEVRSFIGQLTEGCQEAILALVPELAESEDERNWKAVMEYVKDDALRDWLEKQKEQKPADIPSSGSGAMGTTPPAYKLDVKPAEWSEEDENKIESIKGLITTGRFVDTNTIRTIWKLLDSLRPQPHWKPSERMMDALEHAVNRTDSIEVQGALYDLQQELNKLV